MAPIIQRDRCQLCGTCIEVCPEDVYRMTDDGPQVIHETECWYCGACAMDCPNSAIRIKFPISMRVSVLRGEDRSADDH